MSQQKSLTKPSGMESFSGKMASSFVKASEIAFALEKPTTQDEQKADPTAGKMTEPFVATSRSAAQLLLDGYDELLYYATNAFEASQKPQAKKVHVSAVLQKQPSKVENSVALDDILETEDLHVVFDTSSWCDKDFDQNISDGIV